jgi:hypothetical protein
MATQKEADDVAWPEAKLINSYAKSMCLMALALNGLSVLIVTWITVVLLGGFVSVLETKDFWSLTVITVIQLPGLVPLLAIPFLH